MQFPPTRTAGLERLSRFLPRAGRAYAANRNYDRPGTGHRDVSGLSPYLRHRLLTEAETLTAVLARHSPSAAEKFVQEVFWRTYWKGWLEMRPGVWATYRQDVRDGHRAAAGDTGLSQRLAAAEAGRTGIDCFDAWAQELVDTGYLHNHARMWTASIWIFTLRLPWALGADWFLRHLVDGDPASNTLGWRWVAGLQTRGKAYIARADNIARYTEGRFHPVGALNEKAQPLDGPAPPPITPLSAPEPIAPDRRTGVLLTEEDLSPADLIAAIGGPIAAHASLSSIALRSPGTVGAPATAFTAGAIADARDRWQARLGAPGPSAETVEEIVAWARAETLEQVVTAMAPVGPAQEAVGDLRAALGAVGIRLVSVRRDWDTRAWPCATHGFFKFKSRIPELISAAGG